MAEATRFERDGKNRVFLNLSAKEAMAIKVLCGNLLGPTDSWAKHARAVYHALDEITDSTGDDECNAISGDFRVNGPLPKAVWK